MNMNELSPILAIETSDSICGVSVYFDETKYFSAKVLLKHSHSEKLFEIIKSVVEQAQIEFEEIKLIAVSSGPGSFTGLRIGMSAAKGIAQILSIPILDVPTFEALAMQISVYSIPESSFIIANKVGKDELYFGKFQIKSNNDIFKQELKIIQNTELDALSADQLIFGNVDINNVSDSKRLKNISAPDPEFIAKWASLYGSGKEVTDFDFLEPNYLKEFLVKEKKL